MYRRSTNNPWVSPDGFLNSGYFGFIGGEDTAPVLATAGGSRFPGLIGTTVVHSFDSANKASKTTVGTLHQGVYQLVKFASTLTATGGNIQRGEIVHWDTLANNGLNTFTVTNTPSATLPFRAGIVVNADTAVANAQGKFGWIQVAGLASVRYGTVASAVLGNVVIQATLTANEADAVADAGTTFATNGGAKLVIGLAYETPASDTVRRVLLNPFGFYPNVGRG
jgi:hypothetical protein